MQSGGTQYIAKRWSHDQVERYDLPMASGVKDTHLRLEYLRHSMNMWSTKDSARAPDGYDFFTCSVFFGDIICCSPLSSGKAATSYSWRRSQGNSYLGPGILSPRIQRRRYTANTLLQFGSCGQFPYCCGMPACITSSMTATRQG